MPEGAPPRSSPETPAAATPVGPSFDYERLLAGRTRRRQRSVIRDFLGLATTPGLISLGGGYPATQTFPLKAATIDVAGLPFSLEGADLATACQYGPTQGQPDLIARIVEWHRFKSDVRLAHDQVCVLNGSQEGLFVAAYLFLDPGDPVALSEPVYPGALGAFSAFTDNFLAIPQDNLGMIPDALRQYLSRRQRKDLAMPKFVYVQPNGHNPAGVSMDLQRRSDLLRVASDFDLLVIEDDPYELLKFRKEDRHPTLQALDTQGRVIRLDSFSKVFVPGFRIGYASGPPALIREFETFKQGANLHTSSFAQLVLDRAIGQLGLEGLMAHVQSNCDFYRTNCDALMEAVDRELGGQVTYNRPDGGFFLWLEFRQDRGAIDTLEMVRSLAQATGVLAIPGQGFSLGSSLGHCLRLSFSQQTPERLADAAVRLARMVDLYRQRPPPDERPS